MLTNTEPGESRIGGAFAIGCEARVLYALLTIFDQLHSHAFLGKAMFGRAVIKALCRSPVLFSKEDSNSLLSVGAQRHLLDSSGGSEFLLGQSETLRLKLDIANNRTISECVVDVFGFSRGAAEARVFCSWLAKIALKGRLAGIPLRIRFLGIFDTVASAGFWNGVATSINNSTDGHAGWAEPQHLKVPPMVENCAHFIAMHELRKNFPLDEIGQSGSMPKGHIQVAYPGSHSDVGGGYGIGELGVSVGPQSVEGDSAKLSQIPLNHMLEAARSAGVPMAKEFAGEKYGGKDQFQVAEKVRLAFDAFLRESGAAPRHLREWMQPYLNWRWQIRKNHAEAQHVHSANIGDKVLLKRCNAKFIEDAALLEAQGKEGRASAYVRLVVEGSLLAGSDRHYRSNESKIVHLDQEAALVFATAKTAPPVSPSLAKFFDTFVHDSYAGFSKVMMESTGYWRYRKVFRGDGKPRF